MTAAEFSVESGDRYWESDATLQSRAFSPGSGLEAAARFHTLHEIFEAQADLRPNAVAVAFGIENTTYLELEHRANRLARHLRARGVRPESRVALLLTRSTDIYAAILGVLKAGAAYVPIDPEYPVDRVAFILEDSGAKVLVTNAEFAERHASFGGAIIRLDTDRDAIEAERATRLHRNAVGVGPRDLCYIIYTSGSTGRPKGVMIEHRSACQLVCAEGRIFAVRPNDRIYQGFSLSFDASVEEVWLAFYAGAMLVAATPEMAHAGPDLSRMLHEAGVTVLSCVPTLLSMLVEDVPTLRLLILGGEACHAGIVERWARSGRRIVNTYGPTEATVIATCAELQPGQPVTIGRAVPGYRVYVLDDSMQAVPPGVAGEIWIGGIGVARGYVGLPELTQARFVPDPFAPPDEPDARIYRTGDLGRLDDEGNIKFHGRSDSQVKLRGFRVELTEIESVLMQTDGVLAAACTVREDAPGIQQLIGYVVPSNGQVDEEQLHGQLRRRLPAYMVPALIETVSELPRLPSGKLDRAKLPAPQPREAKPESPGTRPRTEAERRITAVWESLFRPLPVSLNADFFLDLGGHSLLVARAVSELRKDAHFARISVADLYRHPTIESLAAAFEMGVAAPRQSAAGSSLHELQRSPETPLLPFVYRLFGARIGKDVHIESDDFAAFDLVEIGAGTSVDDKGALLGCAVEQGELVLGPVQVGRNCFVGTGSVLREYTGLEDGARLEDLSLLPTGSRIPRGETWAGSPARRVENPSPASTKPPLERSQVQRAGIVALYALLALVIPALTLGAFIPGVVLLTHVDPLARPLLYVGLLPLVGGSFVLLLTTGVVVLKRLLVGRIRPGTYPVHGSFYVRKWVIDQLLAISLDVVGSLHATLYLTPWYRLLGAKIGRGVELSTASATTPDLLEIDDGGTVADEVSLGAARIEGGWMTLAPTRVGRRAFVGNGGVLQQGTALGDGSLIGVLSVSPSDPALAAQPGASWMGSPPIFLPRRQGSAAVPDARTYEPPLKLRLARGAIEILRVTLPPAGFVLVTTTVITAVLALWEHLSLGAALLLAPPIYAACCGAVALAMAAAKWIVIGRYQPFERPLWSVLVWRLEFVNALYEFLVTPLALEALQGTPFLPRYLRLLGSRIGRRTYLHTTGFLEWDLVEIGDGTAINEDCVLQTHLFEDRVLKASRLRVGNGCDIGAGSVVLYDSEMEDGSRLDAVSLLMKGERLPAGTSWAGSPAASA